MGWFKTLRVGFLLLILLVVAAGTCQERYRSTRWRVPLFVALYPIAADGSAATRSYVDSLRPADFQPIDSFFVREARRFALRTEEPVRTRLRSALAQGPPERDPRAGVLGTAFWSLKLRFWAWRVSRHALESDDVRIFILYHDPALTPTVPHSLGLAKGLIGVVYAFATPTMTGDNDVIIAHELLHTVGATDKYDPGNDAPRFPDGYGDPRQVPLYPQRTAELMAGRRMLGPSQWQQVATLDDVVIGPETAMEIRWRRP